MLIIDLSYVYYEEHVFEVGSRMAEFCRSHHLSPTSQLGEVFFPIEEKGQLLLDPVYALPVAQAWIQRTLIFAYIASDSKRTCSMVLFTNSLRKNCLEASPKHSRNHLPISCLSRIRCH